MVTIGRNIDEWMRLWPLRFDLQLLSLNIRGPESTQLQLSHSNVLLIHYLICSRSLTELRLENVVFRHKDDWVLIVECLDPYYLETFVMCTTSGSQFLATRHAVDLFTSMFSAIPEKERISPLVFTSFTLTVGILSQMDHACILNVFRLSCFDHLRISCDPLSPSRSSPSPAS